MSKILILCTFEESERYKTSMKIHSFSFKNSFLGWEVEKINFEQLNLIVGLSGAGKTQILNALWFIRGISLGKTMNDVSWSIHFSNDGASFEWSGSFSSEAGGFRSGEESSKYKVEKEELRTLDGKRFIRRKSDGSIEVNDPDFDVHNETISPRLAGNGLIFQLYAEEHPFIKTALQGFKRMVLRDHTISQSNTWSDFYRLSLRYNASQYKNITIDDLKASGFSTAERLLIAYRQDLQEYHDIVEQFQTVFPQVSELRVEEIRNVGQATGHIEYQIKAGRSRKWIPHWNISSGMLRILNYLAEVHLANGETVFLIDEFENSLGHNCLPVLAEDIVQQSINHQFIITSHHPDIINEFPMNQWIVVNRTNGSIKNQPAKQLSFSRSLHEPYLALINHFDTNSPAA